MINAYKIVIFHVQCFCIKRICANKAFEASIVQLLTSNFKEFSSSCNIFFAIIAREFGWSRIVFFTIQFSFVFVSNSNNSFSTNEAYLTCTVERGFSTCNVSSCDFQTASLPNRIRIQKCFHTVEHDGATSLWFDLLFLWPTNHNCLHYKWRILFPQWMLRMLRL